MIGMQSHVAEERGTFSAAIPFIMYDWDKIPHQKLLGGQKGAIKDRHPVMARLKKSKTGVTRCAVSNVAKVGELLIATGRSDDGHGVDGGYYCTLLCHSTNSGFQVCHALGTSGGTNSGSQVG